MKLETLSFQEILNYTPDVFESVMVAGQRARQINARRAAERMEFEEEYLEDEYVPMEVIDDEDYVESAKSGVLAMQDFLEGKLIWRYVEPESDDMPDES
ncbi:DNA-directed RNA polymerase subunit omega [Candidatus Neomarinimicrobiota bacterium]